MSVERQFRGIEGNSSEAGRKRASFYVQANGHEYSALNHKAIECRATGFFNSLLVA